MKEAFKNYAGSIYRTKLPVQYKTGFCRCHRLILRASKSLRVAIGAIALSVLSDVQERMIVIDNQTKGISTAHYSLFAVIQKLKKIFSS